MKEYELIWEIFNKFDKCGIISFTLYGSAVSRKATDSV